MKPISDVEAAITPDTKIIVFTHASNVLGTIQPIGEIGALARKKNILFLVDAAQTAGVIPIDVQAQNIDLLAFTGHKSLLGPMGTGGLIVNCDAEIHPLISGGTGGDSAYDRSTGLLSQPSGSRYHECQRHHRPGRGSGISGK